VGNVAGTSLPTCAIDSRAVRPQHRGRSYSTESSPQRRSLSVPRSIPATDNAAPIAILVVVGSPIAMIGLVLRRKATSR
jgi:hypothetical protein